MAKNLVVVESPSKAKTIEKILGKNYEVIASYGHVIDLPKTTIGIDIEDNFTPKYKVINGKGKVLKELKDKSKKADKVYLASDLDREGEAIAWHIANYINMPDKISRIEFNEITKTAVSNAVKNPRDINIDLVNAQQARRLLDRIVGYKISPLLWQTISKNASAGRVQSVALKLICDLEDEIKAFIEEEYWELSAELDNTMILQLYKYDNKKMDRCFDNNIVKEIEKKLKNKSLIVNSVDIKKKQQRPPLVFKTSTLQQSASSYLGYGTKKTMRIAQQLYEGLNIGEELKGLITYMRTDSTRVSNDAINAAHKYIEENYGKEYNGYYRAKKDDKSQDAHEGIRPTYIELTPDSIKDYLSNEQYRIYKLIWDRFITSQFKEMKYEQMQIKANHDNIEFKGIINKIIFDGYYKIYKDEDELKTQNLPDIKVDDEFKINKLLIKEGKTKAPARYNEASLVKKLEAEGIGRPSTYSSIIENLKTKEYVESLEKRLYPTSIGYEVKQELEKYFSNIINVSFTANMENDLDKIASGDQEWKKILSDFYNELSEYLTKYQENIKEWKEAKIYTDMKCKNGSDFMLLKMGRFGKYLVCESDEKEKITIKNILIDEEEISKGKVYIKDKIEEMLNEKNGKPTDVTGDGIKYLLKLGRYGYYLESDNYNEDNKRIPLPYEIRNKIKKGNININNGVYCLNDDLSKIIYEEQKIISDAGKCEKCGNKFDIKMGRFGKFLACHGYPDCKNIKKIYKKRSKK